MKDSSLLAHSEQDQTPLVSRLHSPSRRAAQLLSSVCALEDQGLGVCVAFLSQKLSLVPEKWPLVRSRLNLRS